MQQFVSLSGKCEKCEMSFHWSAGQKDVDGLLDHFLHESNAIEDVHDIESLDRARDAWEWLMQREKITGQVVRHVHKILAPNGLAKNEIGTYRKCGVMVAGEVLLPHTEVADAIREWCKFMNATAVNPTPEQAAAFAQYEHVRYEKIHPFLDGNGRTGRMFLNWHRVKKLGLPIFVVHAGTEQYAYYKWFK